MKCEHGCNCDVVYLHSRCHPSSPTWVAFSEHENTLRVVCAECEQEIATFQLGLPKPKPEELN